MRILRDLVLSPSLAGRESEIRENLKNLKFSGDLQVIYVPENRKHPLTFCKAAFLFQKVYLASESVIIGVAGSPEEAEELCGRLLASSYEAAGDFDLSGLISEEALL